MISMHKFHDNKSFVLYEFKSGPYLGHSAAFNEMWMIWIFGVFETMESLVGH